MSGLMQVPPIRFVPQCIRPPHAVCRRKYLSSQVLVVARLSPQVRGLDSTPRSGSCKRRFESRPSNRAISGSRPSRPLLLGLPKRGKNAKIRADSEVHPENLGYVY
jgi:hypothetical protein